MGLKERLPPRLVLLAGAGLLAVLLFGGWFQATPTAGGEGDSWVPAGQRRPFSAEASLTTLDGKSLALADLKGEVIFLNFWATWCRPCRQEMPSMAKLHDKLAGSGLRVLAVTDEPVETVRSFLEQNPYPFEILRDRNGELAAELGVVLLPSTVVVDRQHSIVTTHLGIEDWSAPEMLARFHRLLDAP